MPPNLPDLTEVKARYVAALPAKKEILDRHKEALKGATSKDQALVHLTALQSILHKIGGSAGILGFTELGENARACEEIIVDHLASGLGVEGKADVALFKALATFETSCKRAIGPN